MASTQHMIIISRLVRVPNIPTVIAHCSDLRHVSIIGVTCHVNIRDSGRARINIWLAMVPGPAHKYPAPQVPTAGVTTSLKQQYRLQMRGVMHGWGGEARARGI